MDFLLLFLFFLCLRAVYLVRHKQTQMRFAMKKMNKQLMLHRNQVIRYGVKKKKLQLRKEQVCSYRRQLRKCPENSPNVPNTSRTGDLPMVTSDASPQTCERLGKPFNY